MIDIESKGCYYTLSNNKGGSANIEQRLGKAICNVDWRIQFENTQVFAYPPIGSDHSTILINLDY